MKWIDRRTYGIFFYISFIMFMVLRYANLLMLHQVADNPIRSPRIDPTIWLIQYINWPAIFSHSFISVLFDIIIFTIPIIITIRLFRNKSTQKLILFHGILFGIYVLTIYCFPTLSIRKYLGLLLIPLAFVFHSERRYFYMLEILRYYVCFLFGSAGIWKLLRGIAWHKDQMVSTLKSQHIDSFIHFPDHFVTQIIEWLIHHPFYAQSLLILAILTQLSFLIGFFTKQLDRILCLFIVIFVISDFLIMRIEYWEFVVFIPLFLRQNYSKS